MYLILEERGYRVNAMNNVLLLPKARLGTGSRSEAKATYVTAHVKGAGLPNPRQNSPSDVKTDGT